MTALSVVISIVVGAIYASMGGTQIMLTITCSLPVIERLHQENAINYQEARLFPARSLFYGVLSLSS